MLSFKGLQTAELAFLPHAFINDAKQLCNKIERHQNFGNMDEIFEVQVMKKKLVLQFYRSIVLCASNCSKLSDADLVKFVLKLKRSFENEYSKLMS